jgi:hypothetical protein
MPKAKPSGWLDDLKAAVREGKTFKEVTDELTTKYGNEEGKVGVSTYGKLKKLAFPEGKVSEVIKDVQEGRRNEQATKKTLPLWTPQKQAAGDKSQLAKVINEVLFFVIPCETGELKLEHVQEINVGGGIVNTIQYAVPQIDLSNPILVLALRIGLLIVKVKKLCLDIKGKIKTGVKPGFIRTDTPETPDVPPIISLHPLDKPEMKELWEVKREKK